MLWGPIKLSFLKGANLRTNINFVLFHHGTSRIQKCNSVYCFIRALWFPVSVVLRKNPHCLQKVKGNYIRAESLTNLHDSSNYNSLITLNRIIRVFSLTPLAARYGILCIIRRKLRLGLIDSLIEPTSSPFWLVSALASCTRN